MAGGEVGTPRALGKQRDPGWRKGSESPRHSGSLSAPWFLCVAVFGKLAAMSATTSPSKPSAKPSFQMPPPSPEHQATQKVATRFAELVAAGKNLEAMKELYAENARHVEVMEAPWCPRVIEGKAGLLKKVEEFAKMTTVHGATCGTPVVNGDQFLCAMSLDCTSNAGPMAGQRMNMVETALYTVRGGKIVEGKFFYGCGG